MAKIAEQKVIGIVIAAGLCVVAGVFALMDKDKPKPEQPEGATVSVAPAAPEDTTTGAVPPPKAVTADELKGTPWSGKVLVSKRPVQVLAAPNASASAIYGFPAGRPFRALGSEGGFVRIQDIRSGASGWIEEAALAPAPERPVQAAPTASTGGGRSVTSAKPANKNTAQAVAPSDAEPEPTAQPKRRGLFGGGGGGLFGGLFGGR